MVRLENASVDDPTGTANFEAQGEINQRSKNSFDLSASFTVAGAKPSIPSKLRWFRAEPLWQVMAEARVDHWINKFQVSFTYFQDFNVNTLLVAKVTGIGLSAGGSFSEIQHVEQKYMVEFFPQSHYKV